MEKMELLEAMVNNLGRFRWSASLFGFITTQEELETVQKWFDGVVTEKDWDNIEKKWYGTTKVPVAEYYYITLFHECFDDA